MAKLPITLEAGTADGILAKTNAIKDETQNKFQHDINAEVIAGINTLDENAFKKSGGTINGTVNIYKAGTGEEGTTISTQITTDEYGMEIKDSKGNSSFISPEQIVSKKVAVEGATADNPQVLLAHGVVMEIMKDADVEDAIAAAWGS
jgi:hypothetical protein